MCGCGEAKTENTKGAASNDQWEIMVLKKNLSRIKRLPYLAG